MARINLDDAEGHIFKVSNTGETINGTSGDEHVLIETGATDASIASTVKRVMFPLSISHYKFKNSEGGQLYIYNSSGTKLATLISAVNTNVLAFNGTNYDINKEFDAATSTAALYIGTILVPTGTADYLT